MAARGLNSSYGPTGMQISSLGKAKSLINKFEQMVDTLSLEFTKLKNQKRGKGGEIHITDAIRKLITDGEKFIGHSFKGKYLDCGTMNGYIKSSQEISKL